MTFLSLERPMIHIFTPCVPAQDGLYFVTVKMIYSLKLIIPHPKHSLKLRIIETNLLHL